MFRLSKKVKAERQHLLHYKKKKPCLYTYVAMLILVWLKKHNLMFRIVYTQNSSWKIISIRIMVGECHESIFSRIMQELSCIRLVLPATYNKRGGLFFYFIWFFPYYYQAPVCNTSLGLWGIIIRHALLIFDFALQQQRTLAFLDLANGSFGSRTSRVNFKSGYVSG